jgi:hypothetical protein
MPTIASTCVRAVNASVPSLPTPVVSFAAWPVADVLAPDCDGCAAVATVPDDCAGGAGARGTAPARAPGAGRSIGMKTWSAVIAELLVDTRTVQGPCGAHVNNC